MAIRLPGGTAPLTAARRGDPVPVVPVTGAGIRSVDGRSVVTLADADLLAGAGSVGLEHADGSVQEYEVQGAAATVTAAEAAAMLDQLPRGHLLVLAATGDGTWIVLVGV